MASNVVRASGQTLPGAWCWEASARAAAQVVDAGAERGTAAPAPPIPVVPVVKGQAEAALAALPPSARRWADISGFTAKSGEYLLIPGPADGGVSRVLLGLDSPADVWGWAALPRLPAGADAGGGTLYAVEESHLGREAADAALLGFMLGCYRFTRYKSPKASTPATQQQAAAEARPRLVCPALADRPRVEALARAVYFARDLINTPANDLGPAHLVAEARALAAAHRGAEATYAMGDELLEEGFPAVHAVGRASSRPPAVVEIRWAPAPSRPSFAAAFGPASSAGQAAVGTTAGQEPSGTLPLVALVGKGVCFDTGGLNLKTAAGMKTMKKDMGGSALLLALAHVVMSWRLPVQLRVLVPAVENSVAGDAYRPLDVLDTRAGVTVEQGNCDAEGRLILADALYEAASSSPAPDLIVDAATLTGAARTALGPELPAVFSSDDTAWAQLEAAAAEQGDPLWRLPLYAGYRRLLDSKIGDLGSVSADAGGQGGAIVAAVFLKEFVTAGAADGAAAAGGAGLTRGRGCRAPADGASVPAWLHIDTGAWVGGGMVRPGRPDGGEALGLMALASMLERRYKAQDIISGQA